MRVIARRRRRGDELGEVAPAAGALEESLVFEALGERELVNRLAAVGELAHGGKDEPVLFGVKRVSGNGVGDVVNGVGPQK